MIVICWECLKRQIPFDTVYRIAKLHCEISRSCHSLAAAKTEMSDVSLEKGNSEWDRSCSKYGFRTKRGETQISWFV